MDERDPDGVPSRVSPVVELDTDQVEAMFGRALNEGESASVTVTVSRVSDSGNYELEVDREDTSDDDAKVDAALGYPRSKLFPKPPAPKLSASDLI